MGAKIQVLQPTTTVFGLLILAILLLAVRILHIYYAMQVYWTIFSFPMYWGVELGSLNYILLFQSIPADMEFDPNSNPPCYKTKEEVSAGDLLINYLFATEIFLL